MHISREQIFAFIDGIKSAKHTKIILIDAATDEEAWQLLKNRPDKAWSLVDATS
jgi:DNA helicase IV